jgi:hypothetical protein
MESEGNRQEPLVEWLSWNVATFLK